MLYWTFAFQNIWIEKLGFKIYDWAHLHQSTYSWSIDIKKNLLDTRFHIQIEKKTEKNANLLLLPRKAEIFFRLKMKTLGTYDEKT